MTTNEFINILINGTFCGHPTLMTFYIIQYNNERYAFFIDLYTNELKISNDSSNTWGAAEYSMPCDSTLPKFGTIIALLQIKVPNMYKFWKGMINDKRPT